MMLESACSECGKPKSRNVDGWVAAERERKQWMEWCGPCKAYTQHKVRAAP